MDPVSLANCTEKLVLAATVVVKYPLSTKSEFAGADPHCHCWRMFQFTPPSELVLRMATLVLEIAMLELIELTREYINAGVSDNKSVSRRGI